MRSVVALVLGLAAAAGLVLLIARGERLPEGPQEVAWDREACAECRMHVGDPRFAVQAQLLDGRVLAFDDPGCWFAFETRERPGLHALYFHDARGDAWLSAADARFVRMDGTPMGFGLGAVAAGTGSGAAPALTIDQARAAALAGAGAGPS